MGSFARDLLFQGTLRPPKALMATGRRVRDGLAEARTGQGMGRAARRAVFLPTFEAGGAARLRIHAIAQALGPMGWDARVLPPGLSLKARRRLLVRHAPHVIVMQGVRHPLNRPHLYPGRTILLDLDDADFHLPRFAEPLSHAVTGVAGVVAGSRYVARWAQGAGAGEVRVIWTGAPPSSAPSPPQAGRPPVLAWAQTRPESYAREAAFVADVLRRLADKGVRTHIRLYDRRNGDNPAFPDLFSPHVETVDWRPPLDYPAYLASFDDVALGLCPLAEDAPFSRGKSFGKVLGYLDRKVPVIASDIADHGLFFNETTGVVANDPALWAEAAARLLADPDARQRMADAAHAAFLDRLTTDAAARRLAAWMEALWRHQPAGHPSTD